jgi:diguanylate cyclase (GGDEF)-like protein
MKKHDTDFIYISCTDAPNDKENRLKNISLSEHADLLFDKIVNTTQDCLFWKDTQRRFLGANQMFMDYYGLETLDDLIGKTDEDMGWHINPEPFRSDELRVINDKESIINVPGQCIVKGEVRDIRASKKPLYLNGKVVGLMGYFIDVTVEKFEMERLAKLSTTDELTGVTNRRGYRKLVHQYQNQYLEDETDFGLFMLDLDDFKAINDRHGHEYGNDVLKAVCEGLRNAAADNSVIVRYGGDEFVVLHQFKSVEELEVLKSRIQNELSKIQLIDGVETVVNASIGYAKYSDFDDVDRMIESADANMYKDKRAHKMH